MTASAKGGEGMSLIDDALGKLRTVLAQWPDAELNRVDLSVSATVGDGSVRIQVSEPHDFHRPLRSPSATPSEGPQESG